MHDTAYCQELHNCRANPKDELATFALYTTIGTDVKTSLFMLECTWDPQEASPLVDNEGKP